MASTSIFHKLRFLFWLSTAYFKKHVLFVTFGLLIGIIAGLKIKDIIPFFISTLEEERIGIVGNYTQKNLPINIQNKISFGLTTVNEKQEIIPKITEKFEVKNEGKTYIFYLKKNIFWHDGTIFTAKDVNYKFKDVSSKIINDYQIVFNLAETFAPFPSLVTQPLFKKNLNGLGEYKIKEILIEGKFINKLTLESGQNMLVYKFYPTEDEAINGFKLGEIDVLENITNIAEVLKIKNAKFTQTQDKNKYVALFIKTTKGIFQEKSFRQALSYAIDDKKIKEKKVFGPISENSWTYNANLKTYDFNLDTAEKLFSKTNEATSGSTIKIKLTVLRPYSKYAEIIKNSFNKLGIETKIETVTLPPPNFDILLAAQEMPIDPDQYLFWHSKGNLNITGYNSPRIDKLLEDGRKSINQKDRKAIYLDFQKFLVEDSPAIFLYYPSFYTVYRK